ncbi:chromosome partition protein Smc [Oxobacter pfennigii]|uniref:Chromosome partition protein Smc n=1 Tax=Oxobacter pfennigii TaxID=36849 RepID=A0A0P8YAF0_9CLOT|nr:chromosome segregation protein SMC [Oxobacter pfennigii]KPU43938.1 chromosome partition protein Smc [Oxobacter pfennigii]
MYLKKIEVKGFKSFADRIELELDKGITGVVGPNGSGKSNISDAVRWVLGEQSAKSLRGGKMEDVIFAGTDIRKPLGYAEVAITIDNQDSMLPIDYSEVIIARRMYRSGESEYSINKVNCRLKDITELFMDTGVGREGYSIVGQGRIDEILSAKPEDRREIFEEAAGIVKYKTRKQESEKKLDATEQNIVRLDDIINELNSQLEPLMIQSENARKFLDTREKLKVLELNIHVINIEKIKEKLTGVNDLMSGLEAEFKDKTSRISEIDNEYLSVKGIIQKMDESISRMQQEIHNIDNEIERLQGEGNVLNEKTSNIEKNIIRIDEEIKKEACEIDKMKKNFEEIDLSLTQSTEVLKEQMELLEEKNNRFVTLNSSIAEKNDYIENMKSEVIEILNMIADKRSSVNSYITFKSNIEKRKGQAVIESQEKEKDKLRLENDYAKCNEELKTYKKNLEEEKDIIEKIEKGRADTFNEKKKIDERIYDINGKLQSMQARHRVLHEMEEDFEGYNKSVKEIMKLRKNKKYSEGICGVVADLIHVPEKYEVAAEIALGPALQNIVTENEMWAKDCIEYLKENKYGRATFLPLTTIKGRDISSNESLVKIMPGFLGFANELITYEKKYFNIIKSLLGRVIVADNMDNAIGIAKKISYSMKVVTLEGEVINSGGSFTGGSLNQRTGNILSRKRELEELERNIKKLNESLYVANKKKVEIDSTLNELDINAKERTEKKHSLEMMLTTLDNRLTQLKSEIQRAAADIASLNTEIIQLDMENDEVSKKITLESAELREYEARSFNLNTDIQNEQSGIKDFLNDKDELINEITSIKVKAAQCEQEIGVYKDRIEEINNNINEYNREVQNKIAEKENSAKEIENIALLIKENGDKISSYIKKGEELKVILTDETEKRAKNITSLEEFEAKKKKGTEEIASIQSEIHKADLQKSKLDMELESIQNKIWDDYEISYAAAVKYRIEITNISQAVKEINTLKEEIRGLGTVNINAIEEYKKVKERYGFLTEQRKDLEEAKDSLKKVIVEMTDKMRTQFIKNFEIIKENFTVTFKQLFGGGRAELVIVNPENMLESGIDIIAQPPGKKLQNLTLLSGGEKALTAIALLFGILRMKPSPFCILDEIDAALDDVNVARYARFLKEFSEQTQFITVTHRKGSMEAADVLYGVTMEEKGVSRIVSIKLSEKAS